jgi:hypothetical protein
MSINAVEMVRKIRDENYKRTKHMTAEEQLAAIKKGSKKLRKQLVEHPRKATVK